MGNRTGLVLLFSKSKECVMAVLIQWPWHLLINLVQTVGMSHQGKSGQQGVVQLRGLVKSKDRTSPGGGVG